MDRVGFGDPIKSAEENLSGQTPLSRAEIVAWESASFAIFSMRRMSVARYHRDQSRLGGGVGNRPGRPEVAFRLASPPRSTGGLPLRLILRFLGAVLALDSRRHCPSDSAAAQ